jgi:cell division septal protein FtsQ
VTAPTQEYPPFSELEPREQPRPRPSIDPRIRERRIEVLRAAGRRRLHVTLVIASAIVVVGLAYLALHSPLLNVDHIRIAGARHEPANVIKRAARIDHGDALPFVDTGAVERRLERLPWIADAHVRREYPGTIAIQVSEYRPTAYMRVGLQQVALIASTGRVIAYSKVAPLHVVQLIGARDVPPVGSRIPQPDAANALRQLPPRLRSLVHSIDVSHASVALGLRRAAPAGAVCGMPAAAIARSAQIRIGTLVDLADKGPAALAVMDHLGAQPFTYIDVSAPQAPVSC